MNRDQPVDTPYAWLLHPLDTSTFEDEIYEVRHHAIHRDQPGYFDSLLTFADLDHVLGTHALHVPDISLVQADATIDPARYTGPSGSVEPLEVAGLFDDGATVIFRGLHRRVASLASLCVAVGRRFGSRMQTNVYLTPPKAQGFRPHWDTHDVFVIQVSGSKQWSVFESPITLPLRGQKCDPDVDRPGPTLDEFRLDAGDVAYLPRGVMHAARSLDTTSLHITLGLMAFTWADFLADAVAAAALDDPLLRANLPLGFAQSSGDPAQVATIAAERLERVLARPPEDVWRRFATEVAASNRTPFTDLLAARARPIAIDEDTVVERRGVPLEAYVEADDCVLRFAGRELRFPGRVTQTLRFISTSSPFTARDLPKTLDLSGNLTLVRRLVREGLLRPIRK